MQDIFDGEPHYLRYLGKVLGEYNFVETQSLQKFLPALYNFLSNYFTRLQNLFFRKITCQNVKKCVNEIA